jgi:N-dimethylarginine dimethylaminohydrolase
MVPRILMCPPEHFGIEYEINAWMDRRRPSDRTLAQNQWSQLRATLVSCGAEIVELAPVPGLPDLVFTANAALIHGGRAILARFRHAERQREVPHDAQRLEHLGFEVITLPDSLFFEGAGDALFCGDTLFAGYRIRSDARAHQWIGACLGCRVMPLELINPRHYHLDTCFCPLTPDVAIYYPGAFDEYGRTVLQSAVPHLLEVSDAEAAQFACNSVVVGRHVVTPTGCPRLHADLAALGLVPHAVELGEFLKSGGSAKCLTLRLDGEEAAAWKCPAAA